MRGLRHALQVFTDPLLWRQRSQPRRGRSQTVPNRIAACGTNSKTCGGTAAWVMTALRLAWRLTNAALPPFPMTMTKLHRATAKSSEYGVYALLRAQ